MYGHIHNDYFQLCCYMFTRTLKTKMYLFRVVLLLKTRRQIFVRRSSINLDNGCLDHLLFDTLTVPISEEISTLIRTRLLFSWFG
jgi:hypothetical protein